MGMSCSEAEIMKRHVNCTLKHLSSVLLHSQQKNLCFTIIELLPRPNRYVLLYCNIIVFIMNHLSYLVSYKFDRVIKKVL